MIKIPPSAYLLLSSLPVLYAIQLIIDFRRALKSIKYAVIFILSDISS